MTRFQENHFYYKRDNCMFLVSSSLCSFKLNFVSWALGRLGLATIENISISNRMVLWLLFKKNCGFWLGLEMASSLDVRKLLHSRKGVHALIKAIVSSFIWIQISANQAADSSGKRCTRSLEIHWGNTHPTWLIDDFIGFAGCFVLLDIPLHWCCYSCLKGHISFLVFFLLQLII